MYITLLACDTHYFNGYTDLSSSVSCVGLARIGSPSQCIATDTLSAIGQWDMGGPLHSLVIVGGELHPLEEKMLQLVANALHKDT